MGEDEKVLAMDGGNDYTTMWLYLMLYNYTLKMVKMLNFMLCVFYHDVKKSFAVKGGGKWYNIWQGRFMSMLVRKSLWRKELKKFVKGGCK